MKNLLLTLLVFFSMNAFASSDLKIHCTSAAPTLVLDGVLTEVQNPTTPVNFRGTVHVVVGDSFNYDDTMAVDAVYDDGKTSELESLDFQSTGSGDHFYAATFSIIFHPKKLASGSVNPSFYKDGISLDCSKLD